jgi:two-component system, LuxR family, sensor kinase FixL
MELQVAEIAFAGSRYFTGFVRDLTERQEAERRIQDLQAELLHASRLSVMGQMASTMAHELNQPLTAVTNYLEAGRQLLATDIAGPERISEIMEKAIAQAQRAGDVIRRLRRFVGNAETERSLQSLNQLVEESLALALVGARQRGVRASLELDNTCRRYSSTRCKFSKSCSTWCATPLRRWSRSGGASLGSARG